MRKIIVRTIIGLLVVVLAIVLLVSFFPSQFSWMIGWIPMPVATPSPPVIDTPKGALPSGPVGLEQWWEVGSSGYNLHETSGFLLKLDGGEVIGVTTAHSLYSPVPNPDVKRVGLGVNGQDTPIAESDTYYGRPGVPHTGIDLTVDYVLLKLNSVDDSYALTPDLRGAPEPGESVFIFSGLGDQKGGPLRWEGTVLSGDSYGVRLLMDKSFVFPGGMSGSPVISQHTGQVVGMVIAGGLWSGHWIIGVHPIGHLVQLAEDAHDFPKMEGYQR